MSDAVLPALDPLEQASGMVFGRRRSPTLAHAWVPLFAAARGGSVLGGNGGDEFLSPWRLGRLWQVRRGRVQPTRMDVKAFALFTLPARLRAEIWRRRVGFRLPWLTPD